MFFQPLYDLFNKAQSMNNGFAIDAMNKQATLDLVVKLNQEQMYEYGIDKDGRPMGQYSYHTIQYKKEKGERYDHITGYDTGEMYASEKAYFSENGDLHFYMDTNKDGVDVSKTYWGENMIGLTPANMKEELKPINLENIIKQTRTYLKKRGV